MSILWIIAKIAAQTWLLSMIIRQSYNFVFLALKKPILWIFLLASLGATFIVSAFAMSWDPRIVSSAAFLAMIFNWPPSAPKGMPKAEVKNRIDQLYDEVGITRGRLKYRLGLLSFAFFSALAYVLLFSETCTYEGQCAPLWHGLQP